MQRPPLSAVTPPATGWPSLPLARLRLQLRASTAIHFDPREQGYKGGAFHNRFEFALSRAHPLAYRILCDRNSNALSPYLLIPPLDSVSDYPAGKPFSFEIGLTGRAIRFAPAIIEAVQFMGHHGIGLNKGRFELSRAEALHPEAAPVGWDATTPMPEFLPGRCAPRADGHRQISVFFDTMVRLSDSDDVPPTCRLLCRGLLRRLNRLCQEEAGVSPVSQAFEAELLSRAAAIETVQSRLAWYDWPRIQWKTGKTTPFGGFIGRLDLQGDFGPLIELLHLGQWTHVGAKTAFGLGKLRVALNAES